VLSHFTTSPRGAGRPAAHVVLAAPRGFEPRFTDPKSAVLPLDEGAAAGRLRVSSIGRSGAEDGTRTRDPHLGKVMLYQLSHFRSSPRRVVGAESQIRTGDTAIFSRVLYQLSYLGPSPSSGGPARRRPEDTTGLRRAARRGRARGHAPKAARNGPADHLPDRWPEPCSIAPAALLDDHRHVRGRVTEDAPLVTAGPPPPCLVARRPDRVPRGPARWDVERRERAARHRAPIRSDRRTRPGHEGAPGCWCRGARSGRARLRPGTAPPSATRSPSSRPGVAGRLRQDDLLEGSIGPLSRAP
jgi:hypothetical protein